MEKQAVSFATEDVETRISMYLVELSKELKSLEITLPMTRKDLASYLGTTPETISRKLAEFEDLGWIKQTGSRSIQLINVEALMLV